MYNCKSVYVFECVGISKMYSKTNKQTFLDVVQ